MIACFFASIAFAAIEWMAVATGRRRLEYLAKPAALLFLIVWFLGKLPPPPSSLGIWFALGLGFSLAGDVLLLLPQDPFAGGLAAFLIAHLFYILAFNQAGPVWTPASLGLALVVLLLAALALRGLRRGMQARGRGPLFPAVTAYALVLAAMVWSAACTVFRPDWPPLASGLGALGGMLFFISDFALAWTKYVRPVPGRRLTVMVTYHLAQFALAGGVILAITRT
jgi:uncharacterized membrane protein YhhN